jgi:cell division protein FtsQ
MTLRKLYPFLIVLATVFTGYVLVENFSALVAKAEILPVRQVRVLGLKNFPAAELIKRLHIQSGDSLLWLRESKLKEALLTTPRLEILKIERSLPDTLVLVMKEKESAFIAVSGNQRFELDASGALIASNEEILDADKLTLHFDKILSYEEIKNNTEFSNLLIAFSALPEAEKDFNQVLSEVAIGEEIVLFPRDKRVSLQIGSVVSLEKLRKARYALVYAEEKKMKPRRIDLRFDPVKYVL